MTKLIVSDIDGTLVPTGGRSPSSELTKILTKCLDAGTVIALASGRPLSGLIDLFPTLRSRLVYICCNGAYIIQGGKTISISPLASGRDFKALIHLLRGLRYNYMVDTTETTLMETGVSDEVYRTITESGIQVQIVPDITKTPLTALKVTVSCPGDPMELLSHPQIAQLRDQYTLVVTAEHYFDIIRKDVDKGSAVREVQRRFLIQPEKTIVFGDAMNDVSMFFTTPNSYAVENAPETVRIQAAHLVMGPENDGVAKCLDSILLKRALTHE